MEKTKRLYRSCTDRMLGGVAGGVSEYFEVDSTLVRLVFAVLIITGGFGIVAYIIAWVIIPEDPGCTSGKTGSEEIKEKSEKVANDVRKAAQSNDKTKDDLRLWVGIIVFFFGLLLLFQVLFGFHFWRLLFPGVIVVLGALIIINSLRK